MAQSRFWESRNLLLSLEKFDEDPAKDSVVRQRYMAELNASTVVPVERFFLGSAVGINTGTTRAVEQSDWAEIRALRRSART
jgi:hypothetical protein